jgi:hypothetical protein
MDGVERLRLSLATAFLSPVGDRLDAWAARVAARELGRLAPLPPSPTWGRMVRRDTRPKSNASSINSRAVESLILAAIAIAVRSLSSRHLIISVRQWLTRLPLRRDRIHTNREAFQLGRARRGNHRPGPIG